MSALRFEARLRDEAPGALLLRIATNLSLNRLRGERRRPEDADPDVAQRIARSGDGGGAPPRAARSRATFWRGCSAPTIRWPLRRRRWRSCTWSTG